MIAATIKAARLRRGLTLAEVGTALGVTRQYVYSLESGRRNPGRKHLAKLAEALGLQLADLLPRRT
jgi:transcriptional regulator with XRE-family HTH domain